MAPKAAKPKKSKQAGKAGGGRGGGGSRRRISPVQLRELWEEHGDEPEGLNIMAMQLGLPLAELQKLLIKHRIGAAAGNRGSEDEDDEDGGDSEDGVGSDGGAGAGGRKGAGVPAEQLRELYEQFKGEGEGYLELISEQLPQDPGPKKVLKWLKAAGLVEKKKQKKVKLVAGAGERAKKKRPASAVDGEGRGDRGGGREGAGAAAGSVAEVHHVVRGAVPQPQPRKALGYLSALQKDHSEHGRYDFCGKLLEICRKC